MGAATKNVQVEDFWFSGLASAVVLSEIEEIDEMKIVVISSPY